MEKGKKLVLKYIREKAPEDASKTGGSVVRTHSNTKKEPVNLPSFMEDMRKQLYVNFSIWLNVGLTS